MTSKTPEELQAQRAQLIASTGLTEEVLRERAEAFQLYPEHMDAWSTVEGIDYLLAGAEPDPKLAEAQAQARGWEEKYFELVEKYTPIAQRAARLEKADRLWREREVENGALFDKLMAAENERDRLRAEVAAARKFAADMRDFCSPHGVAAGYADRLIEAMDRAKGEQG